VLLSSGDSFPHLIQKRSSQLGFVTYLLNYPRIIKDACGVYQGGVKCKYRERKDSKTLFEVKFNNSE
jgi:hypothetical protein